MNRSIFISYAHPNLETVKQLVGFLRSNGFSVWFDKDSLLAGDDWESVTIKEIQVARIFLLCLSAEAADRRGYSHKEMRTALAAAERIPPNSLYIIPVRLNVCEIPDAISRYHVLDVFGENWEEQLLKSLRRAFPETGEEDHAITINTRPITGKNGQVLSVSYEPNQNIHAFLTQVYYGMRSFVAENTYGTIWVLRDDVTWDLYDAENSQQRNALLNATLKQLGFKPNMKLSAVFVRNHPGARRRLPCG